MGELRFGPETWSELSQPRSVRESVEGALPVYLSAAGALGVLPFAVIRFMNGEWLVAVIDSIIVVGLAILGTFVYRTRQVRFASISISILCIIGVISTVYASGPRQILWAYPALMAVFYLLKPREAIGIAIILIAALLPELIPAGDTFRTTTVLITIAVLSAFAFAFSTITSRQQELLISLATKDPLTGVGNRRALETKLEDVVARFARNRIPDSLVMLDLDHFKAVNDVYGHAVGDQILIRIAEIVNLRIRITDSLYRIGGEEFVVVLEGQDLELAERLAEQLRTLVEANELVADRSVTISLGVAEITADESHNDWLQRADGALYRAKNSGRNTTALAS